MGYFSNGTEGAMYEERYCSRCVHSDIRDDKEIGAADNPACPVWFAHLLFAYEETGSESNAEMILDLLIPRVPHTFTDGITHDINAECAMFHPRDAGAAIEGQMTL